MKESVYKNYNEAKVPGISPSSGYEPMHEPDFPVLRVGQLYGGAERKVHSVDGGAYGRCYMKFQQWPKRDPDKNYFKVPNEVFHIGLSYPEISVYCYLLSIEDRETYQCYPSYKTIGKALGMSENTVSKYVRSLEEKGLIRTEPTMVRSKDGRPLNGNLLYTIRPIQAAVELFYERQFRQLEEDAARQRAAERLAELARESPQNALCAPFGEEASPSADPGLEAQFGPLSEELAGTKEKAG